MFILRQTGCLPNENALSTGDLLIVSSCHIVLDFFPVREKFVDVIFSPIDFSRFNSF